MKKLLTILVLSIATLFAAGQPVKAVDPLSECMDGATAMYNWQFYQCQMMNGTQSEIYACFISAQNTRDSMISQCYMIYY